MSVHRSNASFALWVLFAINAINFFDRQILGAVGEPIRKEWGLSDSTLESHVSRILNGLRRRRESTSRLTENFVHPRRLGIAAISPALVDSVFEVLMTVKEWRDHVGKPTYGINDIRYVNQKCSGKLWENSKRPARLPEEWFTIRIGTSWLIYHRWLLPKKQIASCTSCSGPRQSSKHAAPGLARAANTPVRP